MEVLNNTKSLFDFIYLKVALWLKLVSICVNSWQKSRKKTKPKVKLTKMIVTKVLTMNYEDQQKPGKKTKPICWSKSLFLSQKSMIPNYIKICKTKPIGKLTK